jgi:hypothetical protein
MRQRRQRHHRYERGAYVHGTDDWRRDPAGVVDNELDHVVNRLLDNDALVLLGRSVLELSGKRRRAARQHDTGQHAAREHDTGQHAAGEHAAREHAAREHHE